MNARKITLGTGLVLAVLMGAMTGCDGASPRIKRFDASSSNLPLPGGEVTLTWSVKGEESLVLRPFPGAVHGTGITLTVTESTDFVLVASGNGRTDREEIHVGVGEPFTVAGKVVHTSYGPASDYAVYVNGTTPAFTDAQGNFRLEGVVAPYDLLVINPEFSQTIVVYKGLTRPDPTVVALVANSPYSASISGTVSGVPFPPPAPPPESQDQVTYFTPLGSRGSITPDTATGAIVPFPVYWNSAPETPVSFTTLRWLEGTDGLPASFPGYARMKTTLTDGVPFVLNPALAPATAAQLSGSVVPDPAITSIVQVRATVDFGSPAVVPMSGPALYALADVVDLPFGVVTTTNTFTRSVPAVEAAYALTASGSGFGGSASVTRRNLAAGASGVSLVLPPQPRLLLPVQNAVITSGTLFSIASEDEMINIYNFFLQGSSNYSVYVLTHETSISFPDLTAVGLTPGQITQGTYYAQTVGPFESIDDATGATSFVPTGDDSYIGYTECCRSFTRPGSP